MWRCWPLLLVLMVFGVIADIEPCPPCHCYIDNNDKSIGANCDASVNPVPGEISSIPSTIPNNVNLLLFPSRGFTILKNNSLSSFFNLTKLSFNRNRIVTIETDAFRNLTKLTMLWLEFNQITSLPEGVFHDLKELSHVYLRRNKLTSLPQTLFSDLPKLKTIDLSINALTSISQGCFTNLPSLRKVHLEDNQLQTIHPNIVDNTVMLQYFNLNDNKWKCDEKLCPIMDAISTSEFYEMLCSSPEYLAYKRWVEFVEHFHPNFTNTEYVVIEEGYTAELQCHHCTPSRLVWYYHDKPITRHYSIRILENAMLSTLILPNITKEDAGQYSCQVEDCISCIKPVTSLIFSKRVAEGDSVSNESVAVCDKTVSSAISQTGHSACSATTTVLVIIIVILIIVCIIIVFRGPIYQRIMNRNLRQRIHNEGISSSYPNVGSTANIFVNGNGN